MKIGFLIRVASFGLLAAATGCARPLKGSAPAGAELRRGDFESTVDLTGEVRAERGEALNVPQTRAWEVPIRWLVEDGATVAAGARVAEFDNGQVAGDLDQKRASVAEAEATLRQARAEAAAKLEQFEFELARTIDQLAEARLQAEVPADLLPAREYDDRQLARRRAEAEVGKAEAARARARAESHEAVGAAELALQERRRDLAAIERDLEALLLRAPRAGMALVQELPWEGRKLQNGDSVFPGLTVIQMPDLDSLFVVALLFDVDDGEVEAGDPARCLADVHPSESFGCRVREVAAVARELSGQSTRRAFRVALDFDDRARARERLRPGMSMRAEVVTERRAAVDLVARADLVVADGGVRRRTPSGALEPVRLGPCNPRECVVESGGGS